MKHSTLDYRSRCIYSSKKVQAENFFLNMAQLGNFLTKWRGGANFAEKTPRWCGDAMI